MVNAISLLMSLKPKVDTLNHIMIALFKIVMAKLQQLCHCPVTLLKIYGPQHALTLSFKISATF